LPSQPGFWRVEDRLRELSAQGDPLEQLQQIVDFELFRPVLAAAAGTADRSKGGRPPFDVVLELKMLYLQARHGLSFEQAERLVRDRLSWMRFCGLSIADPVPDANTLWDFREVLIASGAFERLFDRLDQAIKDAGFIPMGGPIVDASLVAAPRQRNTQEEKEAIKAGKTANEIWPDDPAKAAQKDTDARWAVKTSKGKAKIDGTVQSDLAIPEFGYKTHVTIDVEHGFIRRPKVTDAAAHDGARLREGLVDPTNTASGALQGLLALSPSEIGSKASWPSMGRYRLSLSRQRGLPGGSRQGQPDPPEKTLGQADAQADSESQRQEIQDPRPRRACLCASKRAHEALHPQHRSRVRGGDDHHGEYRL
jgi:IS5 family transposase